MIKYTIFFIKGSKYCIYVIYTTYIIYTYIERTNIDNLLTIGFEIMDEIIITI